jgi:hypothetical protein
MRLDCYDHMEFHSTARRITPPGLLFSLMETNPIQA